MMHPEIEKFLVDDHVETLRRDARRPARRPVPSHDDLSRIELRLCRVGDDEALEELAQLNERPLPAGSFVLALVDDRLVAARSLTTGAVLTDPFERTAHLRRLLALRAAQILDPTPAARFWQVRRRVAA
jgi:hypothetical protein